MAARHTQLIAALGAASVLLVLGLQFQGAWSGIRVGSRLGAPVVGVEPDAPASTGAEPAQAARIVSLVPALTETLFAIGAGAQVVGVSSFDTYPPQVDTLPRVGALLDPDTERILALRPDLVLVYGSQSDARARFEGAGIRVFAYRHAGISGALRAIQELGTATGHDREAATVVRELESRLAAVRTRVRGAPRPRTLLVFERSPRTLRSMYVSGGSGFLNEMLDTAGGENVFADVKQESVQPSHETLIARRPDVILEVRARGLIEAQDRARERALWSALPSLPAVRTGRIHFLAGEALVVPGPRLAEGAEMLARALHPERFR